MVHRAALLSARRIRRSGHVFDPRHTTRRRWTKEHGTQANYLFYLATAPKFFAPIVQQLGKAGLVRPEETDAGGEW